MAASSSSPSSSSPPPPPPPPPPVQNKSFLRRIVPVLIVANIAVAAYVLVRTSMKPKEEKSEEAKAKGSSSVSTEAPVENTIPTPAALKVLPPIPEDEQRELFKWILEEKRKTKPANKLEKKKIDDEKALLKEFIRAKSIPTL